MRVKYLILLILTLIFTLFFGSKANAANFSTSYNITFDFDQVGNANVSSKIKITNLTKDLYPSEYSLKIASRDVTNVRAYDFLGPVDAAVNRTSDSSVITVKLKNKIVGVNKTSTVDLQYTIKKLAKKQGKIWQLSIPKISTSEKVGLYKLILKIPKEFGEPHFIIPENYKYQSGVKHIYNFDLLESETVNVQAVFGRFQIYEFELNYQLINSNLLSAKATIVLPPDKENQQISFSSINPEPEDIKTDESGNYLASYTLKRNQKINVKAKGFAKIFDTKVGFREISTWGQGELNIFTKSDKYWSITNQNILNTAKKLKTAKEIFEFIINEIDYNPEQPIQRSGSDKVLNDKTARNSFDFADLFIALTRANGIPSRLIVGYAYSEAPETNPIGIIYPTLNDKLHVWVEYFDKDIGAWLAADPMWSKQSQNLNYFNRIGTNHFALTIFGDSSEKPLAPGFYGLDSSSLDFKFTQIEDLPKAKLQLNLQIPTVISGFTSTGKLELVNTTGKTVFSPKLYFESDNIDVFGFNWDLQSIKPFEKRIIKFKIRGGSFLNYLPGKLTSVIKYSDGNDQSESRAEKGFEVKPFFSLKLPQILLIILLILILISFGRNLKPKIKLLKP